MSTEKPARGLGMGLQALLGETKARDDVGSSQSADGVRDIDIARIRPNPDQPRTIFDDDALDELAASIAEHGVLQPILVKSDGDRFMIIAGERRWRAAQRAQVHSIPAIVRDLSDSSIAEIALIENIQREDLNPVEEGEAYRQLIDKHGHTQEDLAKIVHKSRSHVANLIRLTDLPSEVKDELLRGNISMGHARAIASARDPVALLRSIIAKRWSVRQAERAAKDARGGKDKVPAARTSANADADIAALEGQLSDMLGLAVHVSHRGQGGSVTVAYSSLDQLDMICQRLSGEPI